MGTCKNEHSVATDIKIIGEENYRCHCTRTHGVPSACNINRKWSGLQACISLCHCRWRYFIGEPSLCFSWCYYLFIVCAPCIVVLQLTVPSDAWVYITCLYLCVNAGSLVVLSMVCIYRYTAQVRFVAHALYRWILYLPLPTQSTISIIFIIITTIPPQTGGNRLAFCTLYT